MSDPTSPVVLILDPDHDFLEAMERLGAQRDIRLVTQIHSARDKVAIEDLVINTFPDIIVINLDQDDPLDFARPVSEIREIPLAASPILLGTTTRDDSSFKQKAYGYGIDDYLVRPFTPTDIWLRLDVLLRIRRLQKQLDDANKKLSVVNVQLAESNRKLEEMTITDELTGLYNMRYMLQYLEKLFELAERYGRPCSIIMLDLDHFKQVNDKNDHLVGSNAIRAIGQVIGEATRKSDVKARYGGDEYIIALPETSVEAAQATAERLRAAIPKCELIGSSGNSFHVTGSIGVATYQPGRHQSFQDLIKDADAAMYKAKRGGRDRVHVFDGSTEGYDEVQSSVLTAIERKEELKKASLTLHATRRGA